MSSLFGSKSEGSQQSSSSNQAYPYLQHALGGTVSNGANAGDQIANMLGLNGGTAQNQGFTNFRNSTGYQFGLDQGLQSITGNAAASGLVNSGGAMKALESYGQNYANTQYGQYTNMLQQLLGSGIQGAATIGSAGNVSQGTTAGKGGSNLMGVVGSLLAK